MRSEVSRPCNSCMRVCWFSDGLCISYGRRYDLSRRCQPWATLPHNGMTFVLFDHHKSAVRHLTLSFPVALATEPPHPNRWPRACRVAYLIFCPDCRLIIHHALTRSLHRPSLSGDIIEHVERGLCDKGARSGDTKSFLCFSVCMDVTYISLLPRLYRFWPRCHGVSWSTTECPLGVVRDGSLWPLMARTFGKTKRTWALCSRTRP